MTFLFGILDSFFYIFHTHTMPAIFSAILK